MPCFSLIIFSASWYFFTFGKNGNNLYNEKSLIYPILNSDGQIQYLVGVKEDITSYKKEENELIEKARLANFDQLTELPNRVLLEDRIKTTLLNSKRHDERLSGLFFMDLDEFKIINDTYGHGFGDSLLKGVAKRLNLISRESDTVARFGGDEFVMFFPELENINILEGIAKKIINSINEPYNISGESLNIGISIGITYSNGNETYEDFIKRADFAMYDAKNIGKNNFFLIKQ